MDLPGAYLVYGHSGTGGFFFVVYEGNGHSTEYSLEFLHGGAVLFNREKMPSLAPYPTMDDVLEACIQERRFLQKPVDMCALVVTPGLGPCSYGTHTHTHRHARTHTHTRARARSHTIGCG